MARYVPKANQRYIFVKIKFSISFQSIERCEKKGRRKKESIHPCKLNIRNSL